MKALVIGGTGPTGPFAVEGLLQRGYEVTILHRGAHEVEFSAPVNHLHGDPHFTETLEETLGSHTFDVTICTYGRLRIVAEVMKGRTPQFIGIGGQGVYRALVHPPRGPVGIPVPIPENAPLNLDPEVDKFTYLMAVTEQEVMNIHREGHYNATLFRYPGIYGPRQVGPSCWSIIKRIQDGRKRLIIPSGGLILQSRGYAENMAHALMLAVDKPKKAGGQIYNVRDEKIITVREWIELISGVMNHEWEFIDMPNQLARPSRPYATGSHHAVLDITKIKKELGYHDVVPVEEGIRRTVNWYLENPPQSDDQGGRGSEDHFDYETEDRIIEEFMHASAHIMEIPVTRGPLFHSYPHPKKPGELKDHRGR